MTTILPRVRVLGQLNRIDLTERLEKFADVLLSQSSQWSYQPSDVNPIVLLSLSMLIARGQCISKRRNVILIRPTRLPTRVIRHEDEERISYFLYLFAAAARFFSAYEALIMIVCPRIC